MNKSEAISTNHTNSVWNHLSTFEYKTLDYIPGVSIVSGVARMCFGLTQTVYAIGPSTVDLVNFFTTGIENNGKSSGKYIWNQGNTNILRGSIAIWPGIGNITLYIFDQSSYGKLDNPIDWTYIRTPFS
jgi:hypothetical protein